MRPASVLAPVRRRGAVFGPQPAAMGLDDLKRDRQPEAGILPEALMRPIGVEALENLLHGVRIDAGAVVVDGELDLALETAAGDPHGAARRRE